MSRHSRSLNPNLPPKDGKMVASAPQSRGKIPSNTLCENPRIGTSSGPSLPPPSIAPNIAGWHTIGSPKDGSSASRRIASRPPIPGIMSTAPAPHA
eukprot:31366-Pelagococcus_subviridis.AAC.11